MERLKLSEEETGENVQMQLTFESKNKKQTMMRQMTIKPKKKQYWSKEEDEKLQQLVLKFEVSLHLTFQAKNWKKIASYFPDRTDVQCLHRWQKVLNPDLVKGPWTKEEDAKVVILVKKYGPKNWSVISSQLPGRIGKQC